MISPPSTLKSLVAGQEHSGLKMEKQMQYKFALWVRCYKM